MRSNGADRDPPVALPDALLWQRSRSIDATEDEAERFLDLAGFADGRLDPDEQERVAEQLAADPTAAADVAAARALAGSDAWSAATSENVIARACALLGGGASPSSAVIPFPARRHSGLQLRRAARWGSLAAAMAVASWLGFVLGTDTSHSFSRINQVSEDSFLRDFLDPSNGFLRDLTEGVQT